MRADGAGSAALNELRRRQCMRFAAEVGAEWASQAIMIGANLS
jgi:hypothetical protein